MQFMWFLKVCDCALTFCGKKIIKIKTPLYDKIPKINSKKLQTTVQETIFKLYV